MSQSAEKISLFNGAFRDLPSVFVTFNTQHPGVIAPAFPAKSSVMFEYGRELFKPTYPTVTSEGISCSLSFGGRDQHTFVPWDAVYCVHFNWGGAPRGKMWKDAMPEDVKKDLSPESEPKKAKRKAAKAKEKLTAPVAKPTAEAQRVQQPDGTFSLKAFRENRAARGPHAR